jgi:anti-sigma factor RsiW
MFFRKRRNKQLDPIPCRALVELLTDYLEGALSDKDARRVEAHLEACGHCAAYLEQMQVTLRTVGRIEPEDLSAHARDELLHAFRGWASTL